MKIVRKLWSNIKVFWKKVELKTEYHAHIIFPLICVLFVAYIFCLVGFLT